MSASDTFPIPSSAEQAEPVDTAASGVAPFSFPFKPGQFADAKKPATYPGAGKSNHDKSPGRAPNGTRRSMGKR
jgi:hypothetical protein